MAYKELAIITLKANAAELYAAQIEAFLKKSFKINQYSYEKDEVHSFNEKLILLSTILKYDEIKNLVSKDAQIIVPRFTLRKSSVELIRSIPEGKNVLLFNLSAEMALETISLIYQLGIDHINLIPGYPEMERTPEVDLAITPGESRYIEGQFDEIIDLGHRVLDLNTLMDIAVKMGLNDFIEPDRVQEFLDNTETINSGLEKILGDTSVLENQFDVLMKVMDDSIICTNNRGIVYFCSQSASKLINANNKTILGHYIGEYVRSINFEEIIKRKQIVEEKLVNINNCDISFEMKHVTFNHFDGYVIKLKEFNYLEKKQTKLRAQFLKKGHKSKYRFNDIISVSEEMEKTKQIAKRMAASDSSILIIGETGTGKELFAQAIHNTSAKSEYPFVAVNCGAFQESLLQSELFGYEEGSFTGASKGGKIGLFELAHNGTLFLDEIGEMDIKLQAKLLRVIQEKQVRRLGSDRLIDIDVRIIAATNKDLKQLVQEKQFRKDLYYRLNVLPLDIKPLNQRKEDILPIVRWIQQSLDCHFVLSESVEKLFLSYEWEGNVRELRNIVEYLANLGEAIIEVDHLPLYMMTSKEIQVEEVQHSIELSRSPEVYVHVLKELKEAYDNRKRIGRKRIFEKLNCKNIFLSEQEIRYILIELKNIGYIDILVGRGGSVINDKGIKYLKETG